MKTFFKELPYLAGGSISDLDRKRLSQLFEVMYRYEEEHPDSAFALSNEDLKDPFNRTRIPFELLRAMGGDPYRVNYMEEIVARKSLESYAIKDGLDTEDMIKSVYSNETFDDIDVAATASQEEPGWWNG